MQKDNISSLILGMILLYGHFQFVLATNGLLYLGLCLIGISVLLPIIKGISKKKRYSRAQLASIDKMAGFEFEEYSAFLLKQLGFSKVVVTQKVADQGIDIIACKDNLRYGFQCKRWKNNVGNKAIQEVYAGKTFYALDRAIVMTNSGYTASAKALALKLTVELWGREELVKILEKLNQEEKSLSQPAVLKAEDIEKMPESNQYQKLVGSLAELRQEQLKHEANVLRGKGVTGKRKRRRKRPK